MSEHDEFNKSLRETASRSREHGSTLRGKDALAFLRPGRGKPLRDDGGKFRAPQKGDAEILAEARRQHAAAQAAVEEHNKLEAEELAARGATGDGQS